MAAYLSEWLSLLIRWFHVIAGVAWIGASFYFIWLDNHLEDPPEWKKKKGIKGDLWAVHGGGFYEVAKYKLGPEKMPGILHWFKWEAYSTWLSGTALLFSVYYFGSPGYLIDNAKVELSTLSAALIGLGFIGGVLLVYELLIRSPLARNGMAFGAVLFALLLVVDWALFQVFAGRGAFIHVGAVIGTLMVGNVFLGIMPSQRALVETVEQGREPDERVAQLAALAKLRSTHNNYLTLPVIFIMISNHYPMLYGHAHGWLILAAIGFITAFARHFFNLKHRGAYRPSIILACGIMTVILIGVIAPPTGKQAAAQAAAAAEAAGEVSDADIHSLVSTHCAGCHAKEPSSPAFQAAPAGIALDTLDEVVQHNDQIMQAAVNSQYMPLGNTTGMTEEDRKKLGAWLQAHK
ncbi:urate hydroxylase PuuD [Marinobacter bohaiensis]|uniref:urate hydroxylase PuuD n=1 Tax=Marinobacter bohaiensis TaxID=2201898 RepID=UPI000DAC141C|nr:urate hydroxylase PuuD [Marinobacter bohaiensis]